MRAITTYLHERPSAMTFGEMLEAAHKVASVRLESDSIFGGRYCLLTIDVVNALHADRSGHSIMVRGYGKDDCEALREAISEASRIVPPSVKIKVP